VIALPRPPAWLERALPWLGAAALFAYLLAQGVRFGGDSLSYIEGQGFRSPGYVWLVAAYNLLLGQDDPTAPDNYLLLVALQLLFGLFGAWVFGRALSSIFFLSGWLAGLAAVIVLTPYFFGDYRFGNTVQTEAITYPLYLIGLALLLRGLVRRELGQLYGFLVLLFLLVITRKQFLFVYPVFCVVLVYVLCFFRQHLARKLLLGVFFLLVVIGANLCERAYIHGQSGRFATIPFTGIQLIVAPLYVSRAEDAALFADDPRLLELFTAIREELERDRFLLENVEHGQVVVDHYYHHFAAMYATTSWQIVVRLLRQQGIEDWFEIDAITTQIALRLIADNPLGYLKIYFHNVKFALGGYYMMLFVALVLILAFFFHLRNRDPVSLCLFFMVLLNLGNFCTVALVETMIRRYSAYTETTLTAMLVVAVYLLLRQQDRLVQTRDPF